MAGLDREVERTWQKEKRSFHLVVHLTECTADNRGPAPAAAHEQFPSEIKTDLDLQWLPSGKFDCNDLILHLGIFAYYCLRLIGQLGLTGELAPYATRQAAMPQDRAAGADVSCRPLPP